MSRRPVVAAIVIGALLAAAAGALIWMIGMPGKSFDREPPPMTAEQTALRNRLAGHVRTLAAEIGERNYLRYDSLDRARRYIAAQLEQAGCVVEAYGFEFQGRPYYNVEGRMQGSDPGRRAIVVGAHYDSVEGSPGANDNASGVAGLLEMARMMRGREISRPIRFVAFANEEPPFFNTGVGMGSIEYLRRTGDGRSTVAAMLSLETIGYYSDAPRSQAYPPPIGLFYPDRANFIAFVGNLRSRRLVRSLMRAFREVATVPSEGIAAPPLLPGLAWSDHRSFWDAGIPAVMVTDTALFRDPDYHLGSDTPDRLDYERTARVVSGLVEALTRLAAEPLD